MTSATHPKWIDAPLTVAIGRIVMLEERVAECEQQREQIAHMDSRIRFLEGQVAQLTRPKELLTIPEAAAMLRVSPRTLKRWRDGRNPLISAIVMPGGDVRYRVEEIERFLKSHERGGTTAKKGAAQ